MSSLWTSISNSIPTTLYKRLFKFLLKRAIGQFLSSDLDLENLEVQLGNGVVVLRELELNLEVNLLSLLSLTHLTEGKVCVVGDIHHLSPSLSLSLSSLSLSLSL